MKIVAGLGAVDEYIRLLRPGRMNFSAVMCPMSGAGSTDGAGPQPAGGVELSGAVGLFQ